LQALEDLIVQTEIFLQYSLQNKALERLQESQRCSPGKKSAARGWPISTRWQTGGPKERPKRRRNRRLRRPRIRGAARLYRTGCRGAVPLPRGRVYSAETLRDLSKISEVNQKIFRQQTPRAMLNTAVNEVGSYLRVTRALAVVGTRGARRKWPRNFAPTGEARPRRAGVLLLAHIEKPNRMNSADSWCKQRRIDSERSGAGDALG